MELSEKEQKKARQEEIIEEVETVEAGKGQAVDISQPEKPILNDKRAYRSLKAIKSDKVDIPTHLWDERILLSLHMEVSEEEGVAALNTLWWPVLW